MLDYSKSELTSIYALGRLYYEMGYFAPAERIFTGLSLVDKGLTPSRIGLGLIKLQSGLISEASSCFKGVLQEKQNDYKFIACVGLCFSFISGDEKQRARSLLRQLKRDINKNPNIAKKHYFLVEAIEELCSED